MFSAHTFKFSKKLTKSPEITREFENPSSDILHIRTSRDSFGFKKFLQLSELYDDQNASS